MNIRPKTSAQFLFLLAVSLTACAQKNQTHQNQPASAVSADTGNGQLKSLEVHLAAYQEQLRRESERVEDTRQLAISAGIQGDGAGPFIDAYRQQQKQFETLQAELVPQIDQTKKLIVELAGKGPSKVSSAATQPTVESQAPAAQKATGVLRARRGN